MRFNIKLFAFADLGAQFKGPARILRGKFFFAQIVIRRAQRRVSHRQIRIQPNRTLEKRYRRRKISLRDHRAAAQRICLQRLERRRGRLLDGSRQLVHRLQGFAQPLAQFRRGIAQRRQHVLFTVRGGLFLRQHVARLAIHCVYSQNVLASQTGNRSAQVGFACRSFAKFARNLGRQFRVRGFAHQLQCLPGALLRNQTQKR